MKKIGVLLFIFMVSLFLFTQKADARTIDATFNTDYSFFTNPNYQNLINYALTPEYGSQGYIILYNSTYGYLLRKSVLPQGSTINCAWNSSQSRVDCSSNLSSGYNEYSINLSDYSTTYTNTSSGLAFRLYNDSLCTSSFCYKIIASSYIIHVDSNTYNFTDGVTTHTCFDMNCSYSQKYTWYQDYVPPAPPDDTPLLTSFVTLTIDRLNYICSFITSSYIYLSIFVVFILMFVILLIRRLR